MKRFLLAMFVAMVTLSSCNKDDGDGISYPSGSYISFQRYQYATDNITTIDTNGDIASLLASFRRCLATNSDEGEVTIIYLDENDTNYYPDNQRASLTGSEGDVMVYLPAFWYKYENVNVNVNGSYFRYHISQSELDGGVYVPESLVGAYKGYVFDGALHSWSGVVPTTDVSQTDFITYAEARGDGYQLIDYNQHCVIAMMLYAKYSDRDTQSYIGVGSATPTVDNTTGSTNSIGNADTNEALEYYVNGLGIEGVFGGVCEWVSGVSISNYVWTIDDVNGGSSRQVLASGSEGWISSIAAESGSYFDMVPTGTLYYDEYDDDADDDDYITNYYYADYYTPNAGGDLALLRSGDSMFTIGGVAFTNAVYESNYAYREYGSRLAFRGTIVEVTSVDDYRDALPGGGLD